MRVRRWWITGIGVVLAAAVALTLWMATRTADKPHSASYATVKEAVVAVCHADPTRTPYSTGGDLGAPPGVIAALQAGGPRAVGLGWIGPSDTTVWFAVLQKQADKTFRVVDCKATTLGRA